MPVAANKSTFVPNALCRSKEGCIRAGTCLDAKQFQDASEELIAESVDPIARLHATVFIALMRNSHCASPQAMAARDNANYLHNAPLE